MTRLSEYQRRRARRILLIRAIAWAIVVGVVTAYVVLVDLVVGAVTR